MGFRREGRGSVADRALRSRSFDIQLEAGNQAGPESDKSRLRYRDTYLSKWQPRPAICANAGDEHWPAAR